MEKSCCEMLRWASDSRGRGRGRSCSQTPIELLRQIHHKNVTWAAKDKHGDARIREGAGRRGGCSKTLGRPMALSAQRPTSRQQIPHAGQSPTRSGGGRQAPGRARTVSGPAAQRAHLGGIRNGPGPRESLRVPRSRTRATRPQSCSKPAQPGHSAGGRGTCDPDAGLGAGDAVAGKRTISGLR